MIISNDWDIILKDIINTDYFSNLYSAIQKEYSENTCYPPFNEIFNAFRLTPYEKVRVVILGQDPYHTINMANGLSFSVNNGEKTPPSLRNIFIELESDLNIKNKNTDLTPWARQGILLLNTSLSVREGIPLSHKHLNWDIFTDFVIKKISEKEESVIFVLWGNKAKEKERLIDDRHFIIKSPHPSPFSANRGFFGSRPFSKINERLKLLNEDMIDFRT